MIMLVHSWKSENQELMAKFGLLFKAHEVSFSNND